MLDDLGASIVLAGAEGNDLVDVRGRRYLDFCAGFGAMSLGHCRHAAAFAEGGSSIQPLTQGMGDVFPSVDKAQLLRRLAEIAPRHLRRGALMTSGAQAVEFALRTALLLTGRRGVVAFEGAYHGTDLGVLEVTDFPSFREPFLPAGTGASIWDVRRLPIGASGEDLEAAMDACRAGCVIVEPVQGRGGLTVAPLSWLGDLAERCRRRGVLLVLDEILCGMGRSGRMTFAGEVCADLVTWGKALGGGMPVSAVFGREEVMAVWGRLSGAAPFTGTYWGHALSCRGACQALDSILDSNLPSRALALGQRFDAWARGVLSWLPGVTAVGQGLMVGLRRDGRAGWGAEVSAAARACGLIVSVGGMKDEVVVLTPPLNIGEDDFDRGLTLLEESLRRVQCD